MASPGYYRLRFLADLEWMVVPPMRLGQCRVLRDEKGMPFAYAAWASVSAEVEKRLEAGDRRLRPEDWTSGDRLWLIDLVAAERSVPLVLAELQKRVFKGRKVRTMLKRPVLPGAASPAGNTKGGNDAGADTEKAPTPAGAKTASGNPSAT
jgi:cytolysin-activating lysine-acyltransferase